MCSQGWEPLPLLSHPTGLSIIHLWELFKLKQGEEERERDGGMEERRKGGREGGREGERERSMSESPEDSGFSRFG